MFSSSSLDRTRRRWLRDLVRCSQTSASPHSTTIEYFDAAGNRLAKITSPQRSDATGLSFIGVVFEAPIVARVRITSGNTPIDPNVTDNVSTGGNRDIVVMDDFIYGEPHAAQP